MSVSSGIKLARKINDNNELNDLELALLRSVLPEDIKDTILNILGGVRSSYTYVGAPSLKQLSKCTTFVRVSNQFNDTFSK